MKPNSPKLNAWKKEISALQRIKEPQVPGQLTQKAREVNDIIIQNVPAESKMRVDFVKSLIYPDQCCERMPDELTQPTELYKSIREFALIANMDGTANAGKFSFAVKPILGSLDQPSHYQVGIVDNSNGWPSTFSTASAYVGQNLFSDPRVDPMIAPLLLNLPGEYYNQSHTAGSLPGVVGFARGDYFCTSDVGTTIFSFSRSTICTFQVLQPELLI